MASEPVPVSFPLAADGTVVETNGPMTGEERRRTCGGRVETETDLCGDIHTKVIVFQDRKSGDGLDKSKLDNQPTRIGLNSIMYSMEEKCCI